VSVLDGDWIEEGHGGAQLGADFFQEQTGFGLAVGFEVFAAVAVCAGLILLDPTLGEGAVLDVGEDLLHSGASFVGNDLGAGDVVAPLGCV
jgi:hypothetical protein